jgi:hypothetical protein
MAFIYTFIYTFKEKFCLDTWIDVITYKT